MQKAIIIVKHNCQFLGENMQSQNRSEKTTKEERILVLHLMLHWTTLV